MDTPGQICQSQEKGKDFKEEPAQEINYVQPCCPHDCTVYIIVVIISCPPIKIIVSFQPSFRSLRQVLPRHSVHAHRGRIVLRKRVLQGDKVLNRT